MGGTFRNLLIWVFIFLLAFAVGRWNDAARHPRPRAAPAAATIQAGDTRKPLAQFVLSGAPDQAAMRRGLTATQSLTCDSAASLVYAPDVILFAAHEILDEDGQLRRDFKDCEFKVKRKGPDGTVRTELYPIRLDTLDYGPLVEKGADQGDAWLQSNVDDWAVARLVRPVRGIAPYPLADADSIPQLMRPGSRLVTISPPTDNWHGKDAYLATSCEPIARDADTKLRYPSLLLTDCYSGPGASGSAVLADDGHGDLAYLATMIAVDRPCFEGAATCTSTARMLDPDLVARLKGTTGPQDSAADAPWREAQARRLETARAAATAAIAAALDAPMPATSESGRKVAGLYAQMQRLYAQGRYDAIEPLVQHALEALGEDATDGSPESAMLARVNGDRLRAQKRSEDALESYATAQQGADPVLAGYLALRMGETVDDPELRRFYLLDAYRIGGRSLFERYASVAEIPDLTQ